MIKLKQILAESNEDIDWGLHESFDDVKTMVLSEFASGKYRKQPWAVISFPKLKKVWENWC